MSAPATARGIARLVVIASLPLLASQTHAAVGRTPGAFSVSAAGDAQHAIAVWAPPGAGGMQPHLSISYHHERENSILGMGFDIDGFSSITRCPKNIFFDGVDAPVTLTTADGLCLDGMRLQVVSGTHGTSGSEYRTTRESYARIKAYSGGGCSPIWFEVHHRNGLISTYGNSTSSCVDFGGSPPREWALSTVRDRAGNTMTFTYIEDSANQSYRPDEITYATNTDASLTTAPYRVKFFYDAATRPDPIRGFWEGGGTRDELARLQRIEIQHNGSPKKMYVFEYTTSATSGRSRLDTVKECSNSTSDCLSPTAFGWTTASAGLQTEQDPTQTAHGLQLIDVTGDGLQDMVYSSSATSGSGTWRIRAATTAGTFSAETLTGITNTNFATALPINWDGDRFMDLLVAFSGGTWHVLRSNGTNFDTPLNTAISYNADFNTLDLNGDQRDDLVRADSSSAGTIYVRYRETSGFGTEQLLWTTGDPNFTFWNAFPLKYTRHRSAQPRADFDGDTKEDWVCWLTQSDPEWGTTWTATARCSASGYQVIEWSDGSTDLGGSHMYGDLNDDGLSDLVWATNTHFKILFGGSTSIAFGPSSASLNTFNFSVGDFDGDGRDDALAQSSVSPYALQWLRSTGNGLAAKVNTGLTYPSASVFRLVEINGDDRLDVVSLSGTAAKYRLHEPPYDLVASATDGFGVAATFTYGSMTDPNVYTVGTGASYPFLDVKYARQMVKQVTATDGSGTNGTYTLTFTYQGGQEHAQGLDLGFAKRTVVDSRSGLRTEHSFLQSWPYTGLLLSTYLKEADGTILRQTTNSWAMLFYVGLRSYPYLWNSETKDRETNDTHFRTTTTTLPGTNGVLGIDASWGIVTDATTTTLEVGSTGAWSGHSKTERIVHSLFIDSSNWCVRPEDTQFINDLTIASIPSLTRTLERTWDGPKCRVTQERIEPGNTSWEVDIDYEFDLFGNIKKETVTGASMSPRVMETDWDSAKGQFPETVTNPAGHVATFDYDYGLGLLTEATDANSEPATPIKTTWTYDAFGRMQTVTAPDGTDNRRAFVTCDTSDSRVKYALDIERRRTDDSVMRTDNVCFDRFDRTILSHAELAESPTAYIESVSKVEFDTLGRLSRRDNPASLGGLATGYWMFSYDALNRVTAETLYTAGGSPDRDRTHSYNGLSTTTQNFRDYSTARVVAAWGDPARVTDAAGGSTNYEFDSFSQLTRVTDPTPIPNLVSEFTYNVRGIRETSWDVNMGEWTYKHNALGELTGVRDAKTNSPNWTMEYSVVDALGRPVTRVEAEGITSWDWGDSAAANNIGRLESVSGPGYAETFTYDSKGRPSTRSIQISGDATYAIDYAYQGDTGFLDTLTYPVSTSSYRFKLQYEYAYGALTKVKRFDSPNTAYWTLDGVDPRGNVIGEILGNDVDIDSAYDPLTGELTHRESNAGALQDLDYQWDANGNLYQRQDLRQGLTETFAHDSLDRVTGSTLTGVGSNLTVAYDSIGNINSKNGVGYNYTTPGSESGCTIHAHSQKHAVRKVGSSYYCYDKNGNMTSRAGTTITWTSFNLPSSISSGTPSSQFWYGPDRQRFKQVGNYTGGVETTYYVGGILEKVTDSSGTHFRHQIHAPGGLVASYDRPTSGSEATVYFTRDHLRSVDTMTGSTGSVQARLSYDAFGARRDEADWHGPPPSSPWTSISRRGYTEHEHLDNLGLIHMNGRVQDPAIGRFPSADPFVTQPGSAQGWNRYSYVSNNPLSLIDPSGYDEVCIVENISEAPMHDYILRPGERWIIYGSQVERCYPVPELPPPTHIVYIPSEPPVAPVPQMPVTGGGGGSGGQPQPQCVAPSLTTDADRAYDPANPRTHEYIAETTMPALTPRQEQRLGDLWRNGPNAAPGVASRTPDFTPVLLANLPGTSDTNWIYMRPTTGGWVNVTLPGHYFADGTVENTISTANGVTRLTSIGRGDTFRRFQNNALGSTFFKLSQLEAIAAFIGASRIPIGPRGSCN